MRRFITLIAATGLMGLGVFVGATVGTVGLAQDKAPKGQVAAMAQKWEYKVVNSHPDEKEINKLGEDGWDLVHYHGGPGTVYQFYKRLKR